MEAARAGEQGRGFAVVASEVRNLAGRSATAAKEIKELIQDSVKKVSDGSALVTHSGQTLEQIVASVKKVSDIVAEIAAASREQSSGIEQVNRAVMQMDELTQQNADNAGQANQLATAARDQAEKGGSVVSQAVRAMADQARELNEMMSRYSVAGEVGTGRSRASSHGEGAPVVGAADGVSADRRTKARPWAKRTAAAGLPAAAAPASAPAARKQAAAGGASDSDWQEF